MTRRQSQGCHQFFPIASNTSTRYTRKVVQFANPDKYRLTELLGQPLFLNPLFKKAMPKPVKRSAKGRQTYHAGSGVLSHEPAPAALPGPRVQPRRWRIPARWLNTLLGLLLLPLAFVLSRTFFSLFARETLHHRYWATEEFWFFALGALLWLIAFAGLPRGAATVAYVWGHELTHAVWVWLWGGRVSELRVHREGGHILTNKSNFLIALAPYFYPIYSVAVVILYGLGWFFGDMTPYTRWLFLALGFTWTFHLSFTLWMIPKGQSDLAAHGTFFSLVIIYLANLVILSALVILTAPSITLHGFVQEFFLNAARFSSWILHHIQ